MRLIGFSLTESMSETEAIRDTVTLQTEYLPVGPAGYGHTSRTYSGTHSVAKVLLTVPEQAYHSTRVRAYVMLFYLTAFLTFQIGYVTINDPKLSF